MMDKEKKVYELYKVLCLLLIGIIIGLFLSKTVLAYNPFKWQLCDSANMSKGACDDYWEEFKKVMGISEQQSQNLTLTDYYNKSEFNRRINKYYNKTQVEDKIKELEKVFYNRTEIDNKIKNNTDYISKKDFNSFRQNLSGTYLERTEYELTSYQEKNTDGFYLDPMWLLVGLIVIAVILVLYNNYLKKASPLAQPHTVVKKINPTSEEYSENIDKAVRGKDDSK